MIAIIIGLVLLGFIVFAIYPAISAPHASEFTTQDNLEDVITDDNTIHVKTHDKDRSKEITVDIPIGVPFDEPINHSFKKDEDKCPTHDFGNNRELTEHISEVIKSKSTSKKHLTKRQRNTVVKVDKVVKEKIS